MSDFSSPKGNVKRFIMPLWVKVVIALVVVAGLLSGLYLYRESHPGPTCACTGPIQKPVAGVITLESLLR